MMEVRPPGALGSRSEDPARASTIISSSSSRIALWLRGRLLGRQPAFQPGRRSLDRRLEEQERSRETSQACSPSARRRASSARLWTRIARSPGRGLQRPSLRRSRGGARWASRERLLDHAREVVSSRGASARLPGAPSRQRYSAGTGPGRHPGRRPRSSAGPSRSRSPPTISLPRSAGPGRGGGSPRRTFAPDRGSDHRAPRPMTTPGARRGDARALAGEGSRPVQIASASASRPLAA